VVITTTLTIIEFKEFTPRFSTEWWRLRPLQFPGGQGDSLSGVGRPAVAVPVAVAAAVLSCPRRRPCPCPVGVGRRRAQLEPELADVAGRDPTRRALVMCP
jgi:hypothetical protein